MVVAFHAGLPVPGGFVGVDVFFVISGFVITAMLQREWVRNGRISFRQFYIRRFKRLTPALALMVSVTVVISGLVLSPLGAQQEADRTAIGAMLLVANFVIALTTGGYFDAPAETNPLLNTWSLSVEEQFYLVFPALIAAGWLVVRRRAALRAIPYVLVGAVAALSFGLAVLTSTGWASNRAPWALGFYSPFTRAWEFAVGALLALALPSLGALSRNVGLALGLFGAALLAGSLWVISGSTPFPGLWTLLPVVGTLLLLLAGTGEPHAVSQVLASRGMVRIGDWSYSVYLWHWPLIVFARILWPEQPWVLLGAAAVSFAPALASYRWVEQPIRNLRGLSRQRLAELVAVTIAIPVLLAGTGVVVAQQVWLPMTRGGADDPMATPAGYGLGCHRPLVVGQRPGVCRWNADASGVPVYLVGDSNAAQYTGALVAATTSAGRPLSVSTASLCPLLVGLTMQSPDHLDYGAACRGYADAALAWLAQQDPGLVVLSASDEYWLDPTVGVSRPDGSFTTDPAVKASLMQAALEETIRRIKASGHDVVVLQALPHWTGPYAWDLAACTLRQTLDGCPETMPVGYDAVRSQSVRSAVAAAGERTQTPVADLTSSVCPDTECTTSRDGRWIYRDSNHITNVESRSLAADFVAILATRP